MTTRPKPPLEEVEAALECLSAPGALCFFSGAITNSGFAATISFNSQEHRTSKGSLVIALRNATFQFDVPTSGSQWHEEVSELVGTSSRTMQVKEIVARKEMETQGHTLDASIEGKGTFKFPLISEIAFGSRISDARKRERQRERSRGREETTTGVGACRLRG